MHLTKRTRIRTANLLLWALIAAYALFFSLVTLQKHAAYQTTAFDLGNMDQAVWGTLHGRLLPYTNWDTEGTRLGYHVDPILMLLSPFYLLHAGAEMLLILQSLILALGAWPVYALSRRVFSRAIAGEAAASNTGRAVELPALAFAASYLLFPALEAANMFDFHPTALVAPLLAFAFYFVESRRHRALFATALLIMACKEDMTLVVIALGAYTILRAFWNARSDPFVPRRAGVVAGLALILAGGLWFLTAVYGVIPHFNVAGKSPYLGGYVAVGGSPAGILRTLFTDPAKIAAVVLTPEKLTYLRNLFTPVLFTSLFAPLTLLPMLPTLALNLLSHNVTLYTLEKYHYAAPLVPSVVISAAYGSAFLVRFVIKRWPRVTAESAGVGISAAVLLASLMYHGGHGFTPLGARFRWYEITPHARLGDTLVREIPPGVPVSAQSKLNPHLSNRSLIYMFPKIADAEYVLFDVSVDSWPVHPSDVRKTFDELIAGDYGVLDANDGFILLKRGEPNKTLPDAFYKFVRGDAPAWPTEANFEGQLTLRGFDIQQDEVGRTSLVTYWQALHPLARDYRIYPFYYDPSSGRITEDTEQRPLVGLLWYPTSRWQPGETVRLATLPWKVDAESNVGVGILDGQDWWHDHRLAPDVITGTAVVRDAFGGTALQLARLHEGEPHIDTRQFALPTAPQYEAYARFAQVAALTGFDLSCPVCRQAASSEGSRLVLSPAPDRATSLSLRLFWRSLQATDMSYTVFVHLLGPDGRVVSQHDNLPLSGVRPTDTWLPPEMLVDRYSLPLPAAMQAGTYSIELGFYDGVTGERLPAFNRAGEPLPAARLLLPVPVVLASE